MTTLYIIALVIVLGVAVSIIVTADPTIFNESDESHYE